MIIMILSILIGLALGFAVAIRCQQKKGHLPQNLSQQDSIPPQASSYLEDKIWYEAELNFLFKFNEKLSSNLGFQDVSQ